MPFEGVGAPSVWLASRERVAGAVKESALDGVVGEGDGGVVGERGFGGSVRRG